MIKPSIGVATELHQLCMELLRRHPDDDELKSAYLHSKALLDEIWFEHTQGEVTKWTR